MRSERAGPRWPTLLCSALLSACSVGPDYHAEPMVVGDARHQAVAGRLASGAPDLDHWWRAFGDAGLTQIVEQVGAENHSLQAAMWRVAAERAVRDQTADAMWPQLAAAGRLEWFRSSVTGLQSSFGVAPKGYLQERVTAEVTWELDVFGRVRRQTEAANADLEAQIEDFHDLLVVLRADAAQTYVDLRSAQERLHLAQANAELQRGTLAQAQGRFDSGLAPELDVAQAQQNLASTEAGLPGFERDVRTAENRLALLLGKLPGQLGELLGTIGMVPAPPAKLEVGLPTDILRQRPDLRAAERRLAAEVARIGVATAELYPSFSLTGFLGFETLQSNKTFTAASRVYDLAPGFRWRLFEFGAVQSGILAQEATAKAARANYEQTVLAAVAEAEDTLTGVVQEERHLAGLGAAVVAAQRAADLVRSLYDDGLTDFQNVLDGQRTLLAVQDQQAQSRAQLSRLAIHLYRVLGGGVPPAAPPEVHP